MTDVAYLIVLLFALGFLAGLSIGRAWGYWVCDRERDREDEQRWARSWLCPPFPPQQRKPTP